MWDQAIKLEILAKLPTTARTPNDNIGILIMTENQSHNNPWLQAAKELNKELKTQSPEIQEEARRLSRKNYPETWKALRDQEENND
jgi:hypothetical protein